MGIFKKQPKVSLQEPVGAAVPPTRETTVRKIDDHESLGLTDKEAIELYREMLLARVLDQKTYQLNRMGKAPFMISSQGHEATQVGAGHAISVGKDIILPYYRDLALMLSLGLSPFDALLGIFAREADPSSGGRQMPNHWGYKNLNVITGSSPIATHLPHAAGIALDIKNRGQDNVVLCTFGDGATSKGDFHEALNFAGIHKLPIIFLCENNGYAISVPLSKESAVSDLSIRGTSYNIPAENVDGTNILAVFRAVSEARKRAARGDGATLIVADCYRFLGHTSDDDDKTYRDQGEVEAAKKRDPLVLYANYLKEKSLVTDDELVTWAEEFKTQVDADSTRAESMPLPAPESVGNHVFKEFAQPKETPLPAEGPAAEGIKTGNYIEALQTTLAALLESDSRIILLGEDIGQRGGVFRATIDLAARFGEDRVVDSPLAESCLIGLGIGLALRGSRPIIEIQFADFIHSGFDQIISEAARIHYRSNGVFDVPLVIRTPYGGGVHGALYHSQCIEAFYAHIPGLKVVAPSTPADVVGLLNTSVEDPNPVLFLEHKKAYRAVKGLIPTQNHRVPIGKGTIARPGKDLSIITYGIQRHLAERAAEELQEEAGVEVIDLRTISPLDKDLILDSVTRCSRVLIVHEDNLSFGVGAEVSALISEHAFWALDAPIARLATPDIPAMGFAKTLETAMSFGTHEIVAAARATLAV